MNLRTKKLDEKGLWRAMADDFREVTSDLPINLVSIGFGIMMGGIWVFWGRLLLFFTRFISGPNLAFGHTLVF